MVHILAPTKKNYGTTTDVEEVIELCCASKMKNTEKIYFNESRTHYTSEFDIIL